MPPRGRRQRRWSGAATLVAALSIAAVQSADAATIRPVGKLPLVASAGGSLEVTLQVGAATGSPRVGLVLGAAPRSAKGGTRLGGAGALVRSKRARIRVQGAVPKTIKPAQRLTLSPASTPRPASRAGRAARRSKPSRPRVRRSGSASTRPWPRNG